MRAFLVWLDDGLAGFDAPVPALNVSVSSETPRDAARSYWMGAKEAPDGRRVWVQEAGGLRSHVAVSNEDAL